MAGLGGAEHHRQLGRDGGEHRHPLALDQLQHLVDVEPLQQDGRRAEQRGRDVPRPEAEAVRRRDGAEDRVVVGQLSVGDRQPAGEQPRLLVVDDALRQPGRARGRVEQEQLVGVELALGGRGGRRGGGGGGAVDRHAGERGSGGGRARQSEIRHDDRAQPRQTLGAQPRQQRSEREAARLGVAQQRVGLGQPQQVDHFALAGAGGDADHDQAGPLGGEVGDVRGRPVGQQHGEVGAARKAGGDELAGESVGGLVVLRPAEPGGRGHERGRVRPHGGGAAHVGADGLLAPVAGGAVARGVGRRVDGRRGASDGGRDLGAHRVVSPHVKPPGLSINRAIAWLVRLARDGGGVKQAGSAASATTRATPGGPRRHASGRRTPARLATAPAAGWSSRRRGAGTSRRRRACRRRRGRSCR